MQFLVKIVWDFSCKWFPCY